MSYYVPKSLAAQLAEFAARKAVSKLIDVTARHVENKVRSEIQTRKLLKANTFGNSASKLRKYHNMSFQDPTFNEPSTASAQNKGRTKYPKQEPVELWVNTVIVQEDGAEPVRILTGRPLKSFNADRDVTTNNEEFNRVNAYNNAFVNIMNEDAENLALGESKYYSPQGVEVDKEDPTTVLFRSGIYLELHRELKDPAAAAAAKADLEASTKETLRGIFGN